MRGVRYRQNCPRCDGLCSFWKFCAAFRVFRCSHCGTTLARSRITLLQGLVTVAIWTSFVVPAVLVGTPFGEIHLPLATRAALLVCAHFAGELYTYLSSPLVSCTPQYDNSI